VTSTLAYRDLALITTVEMFIVQASRPEALELGFLYFALSDIS
jgi:hypothetical protein